MQALPTFEELKRAALYRPAMVKPRATSVIAAVKPMAKVRASAYCRVSSEDITQRESISIQEKHFASVLAAHPEWENAGLYIDIASGTKAETRPALQRLLADCRAGRVSLILTKSISRFARSTTDLLEMVRALTEMGVALIFEREHIDTRTMGTEFLLTILATLAADESRSISSNSRWGIQKRFQDGTYRAAVAPYGYDLFDGNYVINEVEADIVRGIFKDFLRGENMYSISESLNNRGVPTKRVGQVWQNREVRGEWTISGIRHILENEAYLGIMVLQKTTKDASFKTVVNKGQLPIYRLYDHHPSIISTEVFDAAQAKMKAEKKPVKPKTFHPFSKKLICGNCGHRLHRSIHTARNVYWCCGKHARRTSTCTQPGILERVLEQAFAEVVAGLREDMTPILDYLVTLQTPHEAISAEMDRIDNELSKIGNALTADIVSRRIQLQQRRAELQLEIDRLKSPEERQTEELLQVIRSNSSSDFSGELFTKAIDHVTVQGKNHFTFHFKGCFSLVKTI